MRRRLAAIVLLVPFVLGVSVLPAGAGGAGGHCGDGGLTDSHTNTVDMKDFCFLPNVVRIDPGETVTWKNFDADVHTVTAPGNWGEGFNEYLQGEGITLQFDDEGVFPYVCVVHPAMVGAVVVGDGEGPASASSSIEEAGTTQTGAVDTSATDSTTGSAPASATQDSGMSALLIVALVAGAAMVLYLVAMLARRRFAARDPRPVA